MNWRTLVVVSVLVVGLAGGVAVGSVSDGTDVETATQVDPPAVADLGDGSLGVDVLSIVAVLVVIVASGYVFRGDR